MFLHCALISCWISNEMMYEYIAHSAYSKNFCNQLKIIQKIYLQCAAKNNQKVSIAHFVSILWHAGNKFMCRHGWETIFGFTLHWKASTHATHPDKSLYVKFVKLAFQKKNSHLHHFFVLFFYYAESFENFFHVNNNFWIPLYFIVAFYKDWK